MKKQIIYTIFSNLTSMLISLTTILILPKLIEIDEFGYWQMYVLFAAYFSYLSLGISDGIYIRYSSLDNENDKSINRKIGFQFWFVFMIDFIFSLLLITFFILNNAGSSKVSIIIFACISCLLVVPKSLIIFFLQSKGKIVETSKLIIMEKMIFLLCSIIIYVNDDLSIFSLIWSDIISKILSLLLLFIKMPDVFKFEFKHIKLDLIEVKKNIILGSSLLLIAVSSTAIIGIIRFSVEKRWGIEDFAKVSLALNIINFVIMFVNSMSLIIFPLLKEKGIKELKSIYLKIRIPIFIMLTFCYLLYIPLKFLLENYLTGYNDSIVYLKILFPIIILEGKSILILNLILKILREEKKMMKINTLVILCSALAYIAILYIDFMNINTSVTLILILICIKTYLTEIYLQKILRINSKKSIFAEIIIMILLTYILEMFF